MTLQTTLELESIPAELTSSVRQLDNFLHDAYLRLYLDSTDTARTICVKPYDPSGAMSTSNQGTDVAALDGTPMTPWVVNFPLLRCRENLEPGSYDCRVELVVPVDGAWRWRHPNDRASFGFWSGTVTSARFQVEILPEVPRTAWFHVPRKLQWLDGFGYFAREDAVLVECPVRNGCFTGKISYNKAGQCISTESGAFAPDSLNSLGGGEELTIELLETTAKPQHFWSPRSEDFRVLWKKTFVRPADSR